LHQLGLNLGDEAGDLAFEVVCFGFECLDAYGRDFAAR
jgi:hypothetical protein